MVISIVILRGGLLSGARPESGDDWLPSTKTALHSTALFWTSGLFQLCTTAIESFKSQIFWSVLELCGNDVLSLNHAGWCRPQVRFSVEAVC